MKVQWKRAAQKRLRRIPPPMLKRINAAIQNYAATGEHANIKKLAGHEELRMAVGDYRVLFVMEDNGNTMLITHVGPRGEDYGKRVLR